MNAQTKANYSKVIISFEGILEDVISTTPTAAMKAMEYMASMAIQFSMGTRVDDFIFKSHGELGRDKKREDMANVLGYIMKWTPPQVMQEQIEKSFLYMQTQGLKEHIATPQAMQVLIATGMDEQTIELMIKGKNAQKRNLHDKKQDMLDMKLAEVKAEGSRVIAAAMQGKPNLYGCDPWVSKQLLDKIQFALFGNGKTSFGHVGTLFTEIFEKNIFSRSGEYTMINSMNFQERINEALEEHDAISQQSMFEVSTMMEIDYRIGDNEAPDFGHTDSDY